jgi:TfoX/Sxy family transcriptional regulator of competence genes
MAFDEELAHRLRELLHPETGLSEQRMFGGLAFLINGNMAVSASGQGGLLLRVDPGETEQLCRNAHAHPFVMRGREMDGWLRVDEEGIRTKRQLERWARIGVTYARSLPSKKKGK